MVPRMVKAEHIRYVLVMAFCWFADFLTFICLYVLVGIEVSQLIARFIGAFSGFLLHKNFTFNTQNRSLKNEIFQGSKYIVLWIINYLITTKIILILVHSVGLDTIVAKVSSEAFIVPINFLVMKLFIFNTASKNTNQIIGDSA